MRYEEFKSKIKDLPLLNVQYLKLVAANDQAFKNQLRRWQKAGKILRLKRGFYILNEEDRKINTSRLAIAKELYSPSYVSMEYALSFYSIIPEKVADVTSITTKKTAKFENAFGRFVYQHLKTRCFTGFVELKDEANVPYYMATPEKAVVDFIYLNQSRFNDNYVQVLNESFRFQNLGVLKRKQLDDYAELFSSRKLKAIVKALKGG